MLGLLLVLIILFILAGSYFGYNVLDKQQQAVGTYQITTERAKNVAADANLLTLQNSVNMWVMQHPGERCTIEKLQSAGGYSVPAAPPGYKYEIDEDDHAVLVQEKK